ncbi:hypothetical protein M5K25_014199 [Dendrobium thyrsiflorum]|uniref:Uncharacterized protein n=1 Tax=Dendrobium thyrsiflorum TaxID=117978 RepID=A0ABD0UW63_DENTH
MSIKRGSISAVHSNHSGNTPDLSLIYESCHSQKSINRALILLERGLKARGEEEKRRGEGGDPSSTAAGVPPDRRLTPEFRRTAA